MSQVNAYEQYMLELINARPRRRLAPSLLPLMAISMSRLKTIVPG